MRAKGTGFAHLTMQLADFDLEQWTTGDDLGDASFFAQTGVAVAEKDGSIYLPWRYGRGGDDLGSNEDSKSQLGSPRPHLVATSIEDVVQMKQFPVIHLYIYKYIYIYTYV